MKKVGVPETPLMSARSTTCPSGRAGEVTALPAACPRGAPSPAAMRADLRAPHRRARPLREPGRPLTYDDVELDDGSTILQVRRLQDLFLRNGPPTHARRSRDPEVLRTRM